MKDKKKTAKKKVVNTDKLVEVLVAMNDNIELLQKKIDLSIDCIKAISTSITGLVTIKESVQKLEDYTV
jgi:hypothetical protein